ncbi:MAG: polysaccharide export protein [Bradyrhizobium sp.]|nr:polysaccharide export protein [Bradyrhizobium sp.]
MTLISRLLCCLVGLAVASCSGLPSAAPTTAQLVRTQDENWEVYVVKVTSLVTKALAKYQGPSFPQAFRVAKYTPSAALMPGDAIGITVYESAGSNLFQGTVPPMMTGSPGQPAPHPSTLPLQIIEADGRVMIPYVGRVQIAGKTPSQAAVLIQEGLASQTASPQVVVSLAYNTANTVSVGGEVNKAGLMPLSLRGERLLDAVAWGGGPKYPAVQIDLRLMRGKQVVSIPLQQVMANPADNVVAQPNDNIVLVRNPKTFLVMGTSQKVNQYPFETETVTLAEAIARAGGGIDATSNLAGVYLFRYEPGSFARTLLAADSQAVDSSYVKSRIGVLDGGADAPVIYRLDLTQADGYFFAQQVQLRDKDVVLITTADSTQFLKMMQVIRAISGTYFDLTRSTNY